ncbi:MAG TPA: ABC transporter permease subunit [Clostridiales bacterium]|nr:ABC transporter permease subunit [Clostridiales bacterium]
MKKILKYELKQLLRDKKTIFFVFVLPLVIFPVVNGLLSKAITSRVDDISEEKALIISEKDSFLVETLGNFKNDSILTFDYVDKITVTDSLLKKYAAAVTLKYDDSLKMNNIIVSYSGKKDKQSIQTGNFIDRLKNLRKNISEKRYTEIGIAEYYKESVPQIKNTADRVKMANSSNAGMLPITVIMVLLLGTFMISNYIILGEKDNNTLESLLASGIKREQIIYGKMSMVISAGVLMSVLELLSFFLYGKFTGALNFDIALAPAQITYFILIVITASFLISSFSVFVSCKTKSSTAGQLIFLPVMVLFLVLTLLGTFEGVEVKRGLLLIPVVNSAGMIKAIIKDGFTGYEALLVAVTNLLYASAAVKVSSDYLNGEDILSKDADIDFARKGFSKGAIFTIYALLVVTYMVIGGYLQGKDIVVGLILSQIIILGGFVLIMSKTAAVPLQKMLKLNGFNPALVIPVILLGLSARYPIALLAEKLQLVFPVPKIMNDMNLLDTGLGNLGLTGAVLIIAVLPALFEETVFRGVFLTLLQNKYTAAGAVLFVGLMFGGMHLNVFTFFETASLGIIFGFVTIYSGSIYPAIIMHFLNNAFSVVLMRYINYGTITESHWIVSEGPFVWAASAAALLSFFAVYLFRKNVSAS